MIEEIPNTSNKGTWLRVGCHLLKTAALKAMWGWAVVLKLLYVRVTWGNCNIHISGPRAFQSVGLGLGLRICFFDKIVGGAHSASPGKALVEGKKPELEKEQTGLELYHSCTWQT